MIQIVADFVQYRDQAYVLHARLHSSICQSLSLV